MTDKAKEIIESLNLSPLNGEGGFFRFLHEFGEHSGSPTTSYGFSWMETKRSR